MLILIAESKTMDDEQRHVSPETFAAHTPTREQQATLIMNGLEKLSQSELAAETGLSTTLATRLRRMIYEFPNKALGMKTIEAFTGVVFKAFDYDSLTADEKERTNDEVRVISSLYGFLRPDDIIKPYRLDFTAKAAPGGKTLCSFWKKDVTIDLVRTIREGMHTEVLNLLPADAAKCVDWKVVKRFCKVLKVDFAEIADGGKTKTPNATRLKTMRGRLLREIICRNISNTRDFQNIDSEEFVFEGTPVYPDHFLFLC